MAKRVVGIGQVALAALDYIIGTRLELFDFLRFDAKGNVTALPMHSIPWQFWMRTEDVGEGNLQRLRERLHVGLLDPPMPA